MKRPLTYLSLTLTSVAITLAISSSFLLFDVERLFSLATGVILGPVISWGIFPILHWKPLNTKRWALLALANFCAYLVSGVVHESGLRLFSDSYGVYQFYSIYTLSIIASLEIISRLLLKNPPPA